MKKKIFTIGVVSIFLLLSCSSITVAENESSELEEIKDESSLINPSFYFTAEIKATIDGYSNWGTLGVFIEKIYGEGQNMKINPRLYIVTGTLYPLSPFEETITLSDRVVLGRFAQWAIFEDNGDGTYYIEGRLFFVDW